MNGENLFFAQLITKHGFESSTSSPFCLAAAFSVSIQHISTPELALTKWDEPIRLSRPGTSSPSCPGLRAVVDNDDGYAV